MLYRVSKYCGREGHQGFQWFGTRREAEAAAEEYREAHRKAQLEYPQRLSMTEADADIDEEKTPRTKAEILLLLRCYATHPDNG